MASATVRIRQEAREKLRELARKEKQSMQSILESAIETYRRERFWREANEGYSRMQENPTMKAEWDKEQALLENALGDGLDPVEEWTEASSTPKRGKVA
jgi:hypothetical protein